MRVTQAEAAASERKLAAEAQAFTIEIESKVRADAFRREAEAHRESPEIIQLRAVERGDGCCLGFPPAEWFHLLIWIKVI